MDYIPLLAVLGFAGWGLYMLAVIADSKHQWCATCGKLRSRFHRQKCINRLRYERAAESLLMAAWGADDVKAGGAS